MAEKYLYLSTENSQHVVITTSLKRAHIPISWSKIVYVPIDFSGFAVLKNPNPAAEGQPPQRQEEFFLVASAHRSGVVMDKAGKLHLIELNLLEFHNRFIAANAQADAIAGSYKERPIFKNEIVFETPSQKASNADIINNRKNILINLYNGQEYKIERKNLHTRKGLSKF